ncbi:MAG: YbjN domain-containing protein [Clostridiales bacterium]|nr:YbjN domain-containing protein [Clostridiales bacterium]
MEDEQKLKQAKAAYNTLCAVLDEENWHYEKIEDELTIMCSARGEDLPMGLIVRIDAERMLVVLLSPMPFEIPDDRKEALSVAVAVASNTLADGSFDFDYVNGRIAFRMTSSYRDSLLGKELFRYMVFVSCQTIDEYNDKFLEVAQSGMSNEQTYEFIKRVSEGE